MEVKAGEELSMGDLVVVRDGVAFRPRTIEIMDIAGAAEDQSYYLPNRHDRRPVGAHPNPDAAERDWEACKCLVSNGWARWLSKDEKGPGIVLTRPYSSPTAPAP